MTVTNTGNRDADEIVQLYIRDVQASVSRPVKDLKGFQRVHIAKGESRDVSFSISRKQLSFFDSEGNEVLEPGEFQIMSGPDSRNVQSAKLILK